MTDHIEPSRRLGESSEIALAEAVAAACYSTYGVHVSAERVRKYIATIEWDVSPAVTETREPIR
jgi:hypothetical protein